MQSLLALLREPIPYREVENAILGMPYVQYWKMRGDPTKGEWERQPFLAVQATLLIVARTRARTRTLRVLNALQAHVPAGSNEVPKLTDLGLPSETITDPFTGEPLHVKKTLQGWIVYSVGPNYQDDGGKLDDWPDGDVGVGPPPVVAKSVKVGQQKPIAGKP